MKDIISCYTDADGFTCANQHMPDRAPIAELLRWLVFSASHTTSSGLRVVWDLDGFAKNVLERTPEFVRADLAEAPHRAIWGSFRLFYIPSKVFAVNMNRSEVSFYDLGQYFPDHSEPETAEELQALTDELQETFSGLGMPRPKSLSSPVASFKGHPLLNGGIDIPTIFDASESVLGAYELAMQSTPREWTSNYQVGYFPDLCTSDVSSAYPYHASRLIDLRDCDIIEVGGDVTEAQLNRATYGFFQGPFTVYPDHPLAFCSPFIADGGDGMPVNFTGTEEDYVFSLDDLRVLEYHKMGEARISQGWLVTNKPDVIPHHPLNEVMEDIFAQRGSAPLRSYILKRVMNGVIGQLLETRKDKEGNILEYGDRYNPIYHAVCTCRTRLQVFHFIVINRLAPCDLVHVGVDGVKTVPKIGLPETGGLGEWRHSGCEPTLVLSPGRVLTLSRKLKGLDCADVVAECMARPGASKLGGGAVDLRNLSIDQNRVFDKLPATGGALLDGTYLSSPVEF